MACKALAVGLDAEVVATIEALGVNACRTGHGAYHGLDVTRQFLQFAQVRAEQLDADRGADAGREHVDAPLDRHRPGIGDTGKLQCAIELLDQALHGHGAAPLGSGLQRDHRLEHLERRRVGRCEGAASLAEHRFDLGKTADDPILLLQQPCGGGHRHPGWRGRHVEQRPLVQRRHELTADALHRQHAECQDQQRAGKRQPGMTQHEQDHRAVGCDQQPVDGVVVLGADAPAHEQQHQHRDERHREQRCGDHRKGLGERQRVEQPAFLRLQAEHRQEGYGDDQQAEEQCRAGFAAGGKDQLRARCGARVAFEVAMCVLDHDDRGVDHHADGNRDSAKAHDVRSDTGEAHAQKGHEYRDGQHQDRDQRAAQMHQKQCADQRDDEAFLGECAAQRGDCVADQLRSVIDAADLHALGKAGRYLGDA